MIDSDLSASFKTADKLWPAAVMDRHFVGLVFGVIAAAIVLPLVQ